MPIVTTSALPGDAPIADELMDEDLIEMTNLPEEDTDVPGTIFVSTRIQEARSARKLFRRTSGGKEAVFLGRDRGLAPGRVIELTGSHCQPALPIGGCMGCAQPRRAAGSME